MFIDYTKNGKYSPNLNLILEFEKEVNFEKILAKNFQRIYTNKVSKSNRILGLVRNTESKDHIYCMRIMDPKLRVKFSADFKLYKVVEGDFENHGEVLFVSREFVNTKY